MEIVIRRQREGLKSFQNELDCYTGLTSRQSRPWAEMLPVAKGQVLLDIQSFGVNLVRIGEFATISVGRGKNEPEMVTRRD